MKRLKTKFKQSHRQAGFTMLEVVVAMAVGAVGVMAFIGLQLKAVEVSEDTRKRANAAYIAEEMAERMMSNSQDFGAKRVYRGEAGSQWSYTPYNPGYYYVYTYCTNGTPPVCQDNNAATAAYYDIIEVKNLAFSMLPNGNVGYRKCGTANAFDCIVVTWAEANPATCNPKAMDGSGVDDCYILQVKVW